jgi:hypothetical protein
MAIEQIPMDDAPPMMGGKTLDELEASLPDDASHGFDAMPSFTVDQNGDPMDGIGVMSGDLQSTTQEKKVKRIKMSASMRKAMKKLKERIGRFPAIWFEQKALQHPEWALSKDEEDTISESVNFALELLDIEFMIEPVSMTLTSIWWVIAYPFATIGMVWFYHADKVKKAHPEDFEKPEDKK